MIIGEDKIVRARQTHVCTLCNEYIHKGEQYRKYSVVSDGTWYRNKEHEHCHKVAVFYNLYSENIDSDIMKEYLEDYDND